MHRDSVATHDDRSALERFVSAVFQERNIKWMLVIGAAFVFGSSLMLVNQRFDTWHPSFKFLTILGYTAAKSALEQKLSATQRADRYESEHAKQKHEVQKLQDVVRDLEDKIRQAKQQKTLLTARMTRATSTQKIHSAMDRTHSQSAFAQFQRMEEKVNREESLSEAWDRLDDKDPDAAELAREFEVRECQDLLGQELERLKVTIGETSLSDPSVS